MRWKLGVAILAIAGCKKSVDEKLKDLETSYDSKGYCELAGELGNEKVHAAFVKRLEQVSTNNSLPDSTPVAGDYECVPKALAAKNPPPELPLAITRLTHKTSSAPLKAMYEALPADQKKAATLDAFVELGTRWHDWNNAAKTAAPTMIATLDKLGASGDPKFYAGLVGAYALYDETSPQVKERIAKLGDDPNLAAAWRAQLVAVVNVDHSDPWMGYSHFVKAAIPELAAHHIALDKEPEVLALIKACSHPRSECDEAIKLDEATKKNVRDQVAKIKDSYEQSAARAFAMKLGGGTVDDIEPMLAALDQAKSDMERVERDRGNSWSGNPLDKTEFDEPDPTKIYRFSDTVAGLAALGAAAMPKLLEIATGETSTSVRRNAAARALAKSDPAALANAALSRFDGHDEYVRLFDRGDNKFGAITNAKDGPAIAAAMMALAEVKGDRVVDIVFLRGLSSPDTRISGYATAMIKKRFSRDEAIDALFAFMSAKEKYAQYEIDIYVDLVTGFGAEATAAIVKNLETMLAAAKSPDRVFWAHKVVAMTALEKVGTNAAADVVGKYASDGGGYVAMSTPIDKDGNKIGEPKQTPMTFKALASKTLAAVRMR